VLGDARLGHPSRQRSLRDLFEHSWQLLSPDEQRVLSCLAVFRGGFQRAAAEHVAGADLRLLAALIDTSLVRRGRNAAGVTRYELHALIHQYAAEKLGAAGAADEARRRHCTHYAALLEEALPRLQGREAAKTLAELPPEMGNLRAAWNWALAERDFPLLRRLTVGLAFLSELRGWLSEEAEPLGQAVNVLRAAVASGDASPEARMTLGQILTWYGRARGRCGDTVVACDLLQEAACLLSDDEAALAATGTLGYLGLLLTYRGRFAEAQAVLERNLALLRPRGPSFFITLTCVFCAFVTHARGDAAATGSLLMEARSYVEAGGSPRGIALALCKSAWVANDNGDIEAAERLAREGLHIGALHRDRWGLGWALFQLGRVMVARADMVEATYLLNESTELFEETGDPWSLGRVQVALGRVEHARGDSSAARRRLLDTLRVTWSRQYETLALDAICGLAELAADARERPRARQLLEVVVDHPAAEHALRVHARALLAQFDPAEVVTPASSPAAALDDAIRTLVVEP
jgi:tetratricopeptide (TPR) repeat protein